MHKMRPPARRAHRDSSYYRGWARPSDSRFNARIAHRSPDIRLQNTQWDAIALDPFLNDVKGQVYDLNRTFTQIVLETQNEESIRGTNITTGGLLGLLYDQWERVRQELERTRSHYYSLMRARQRQRVEEVMALPQSMLEELNRAD